MDGPIRGRGGSLSDEDDASPLRVSLSSPRSDDDSFFPRLSQENETRRFPQVSTEDDGTYQGFENDTPRSGSFSPLVQSFAALSTHGAFPFSPKACLGSSRATENADASAFLPHPLSRAFTEPTTPSRSLSKVIPLCESQDFVFTGSRLTPSSQVRTLYRQESKTSRCLTETPARKSSNARKPLCVIPSRTSSPPSLSGSSKRTPVKGSANSGSRLTVPSSSESPIRYDFRKANASRTAPALPDAIKPQDEPLPSSDADELPFSILREMSPPPRHPGSRYGARRSSMSERHSDLLPSPTPIAQSWPGIHAYASHDVGTGFHERASPVLFTEASHIGALTPNEPKNMVAPGRPRKRGGTGMPSIANRSLLNSPMAKAPPSSACIDDVPELQTEACPMMISNPVSDSARGSKLVRRRSVLDVGTGRSDREESPENAPVRTLSSPLIGLGRSASVPTIPRKLSSSGSGAVPQLKQSPEEQRIERARCQALTGAMVRHGVKLLCLDWDMTVIALHTQSRWSGTDEQLARWIRPVFRNLIWAALQTTMRVAFVSFSGQTGSIHGAIRTAFGENIFRNGQFVVRCSDKLWDLEDAVFSKMFPRAKQNDTSKLSHICSASTFFTDGDKENANPQILSALDIKPRNIVLIDDDHDNITDAGKHDVRSVLMDTNFPDKFLDHLEEICGIVQPSPLSLHMAD